jgi:hypothetical protein
MAAMEWFDTSFGYTSLYDLLGIQQAIDSLASIVLTNQMNGGVSNVLSPLGSNLNFQQITKGLNLIEFDGKMPPPTVLNLTNTPPEIFKFMEILVEQCELISGVSSVVRGAPDASLKSGSALALVASQSIQFASGLSAAYYLMIEEVGLATVDILRDYARNPRIAMIAGKSNRSKMQQFSGDDLSQISRVSIESANPASMSSAGRMSIADSLLSTGLIKRPEEYLAVLSTGKLEPILENEEASLLLIRAENEAMSDGRPPVAMLTDDHRLHILEHRTCLDSPEARANPQLVQIVTAHLEEHLNILRTADPELLMMLGQQPLVPPQVGPNPGAPGGSGPNNSTSDEFNANGQKVNLPKMPMNPLSGQQFNNQNGGM